VRLKSWAGKVMKRITPRVMVAPTRVWTGEPKAGAGVASAEEKVETSGLMAAVAGAGAAGRGGEACPHGHREEAEVFGTRGLAGAAAAHPALWAHLGS
jgi:hypothetical protein